MFFVKKSQIVVFAKYHIFVTSYFFSNQCIANLVCRCIDIKNTINMQLKPIEKLNSVRSSHRSQNWCFFSKWPPLPEGTRRKILKFAINHHFSLKPTEKTTYNIIKHLNTLGSSLRVEHPLKRCLAGLCLLMSVTHRQGLQVHHLTCG